jgi:ankyrin repeat protein
MGSGRSPADDFLENSVWHGPLPQSEVASTDIYVAAVRGDAQSVRRFLAERPSSATEKGGPRGWDALTYLCFSKYLRLDPARSEGFVDAARALLDAGAPATTGFFSSDHQPEPEFESALYGAAGVAHHAPLTRLLVERGADPNDGEVTYHTPETYDNSALRVLLDSGQLTADGLAIMLLRKHDWHDLEGVRLLLERGADPDRTTGWRRTAFDQAVIRDNALPIIEALLDHGSHRLPAGLAARRGRGDILDLFEERGVAFSLDAVERLLAECARGREASAREIARREPAAVTEIVARGSEFLTAFAGNGNTEGVRLLLELGVDVRAPLAERDHYWGLAVGSTALHVAAWRARHATVEFLIAQGAPVDEPDGEGRTPLRLAVRACVDSYWTHLRSPESVAALLRAGASANDIPFPSGYAEVDALLRDSRGIQ